MVQLTLRNILLAAASTIIGGLITGYFFSIGADLWERTKEGAPTLPNLWNPFWYISVPLFIIGLFLLTYDIYLRKRKSTSQVEKVTVLPSSQKGQSWFSKFRVPPIKKEKRIEVWTFLIVMVIGGVVLIAMVLSFPPISLPWEANPQFLVFRYVMLGIGVFLIALSVWLMINEVLTMWESRRHASTEHKTAYLNMLHAFDDSFQKLRRASQPKTKKIRLDDFEDKLRAICKLSWNDEIKSRIMEVLNYIPNKFSDDMDANSYLAWLTVIVLSHIDEHTKSMIREKFLTELEKMMDNKEMIDSQKPHEEYDFDVLCTLGILHDYSVDYLMELVDDAAYQWSTKKFSTLVPDITTEFYGLKHRDREAYREFYSRLDRKMEKAEKIGNEQAFDRLRTLHDRAKTILEAR